MAVKAMAWQLLFLECLQVLGSVSCFYIPHANPMWPMLVPSFFVRVEIGARSY